MVEFKGKILILGYGAVAKSALPLFFKHVKANPHNVTVIDFSDQRKALTPWIARGVRFFQERVTPHNLTKILSTHVSSGGLIIDLAWNIDCLDILQWCHNNQVLYVNTSIEEWSPYADIHTKTSIEKSLYHRYIKLRKMIAHWGASTTAVIDHGANPGLISHFTKKGLIDIATSALRKQKVRSNDVRAIERMVTDRDFPHLAMKLGVKVIHCSERDTQIATKPKDVDEFVNTWSIEGMRAESISPVEIGWGTHERTLPELAIVPRYGTRNQIILPRMGINTWVRSWVPHQEIVGCVVTHGEAFSLSNFLTVFKGKKVVYRPTVHFAYMPCNETIASLFELRCRNYELPKNLRVMTDEIASGADTFGALIMGHTFNSWWTGSILSIDEARRLVPHQNATTVQVAIGAIAAVEWVIKNPSRGVSFPEDLPHEQILQTAKSYLGTFVSEQSDWTPLINYQIFFTENPDAEPDKNDIWQYRNFVFKP